MTLLLLVQLVLGADAQSILGELERLDQALRHAEVALHDDESARSHLLGELAGLNAGLASARLQKQKVLQQYRLRVRAVARQPAGARWALLGGSQSLHAYIDTARVLRQLALHDLRLHDTLAAQDVTLHKLVVAAQGRKKDLEQAVAVSRARRDKLALDREARAALLRSVRAEQSKAVALAQERRLAQEKLRNMVAHLQPPAGPPPPSRSMQRPAAPRLGDLGKLSPAQVRERFAHNRGRLPWPASGPLKVAFGQRVELAFGTVTSHNGWDIAATAGTRVQAVAAGQVVYAGWLRGYGQMVIVDHGDGYHSVTAHLASLDVQVGDAVQAGQPLGTVGDTGSLRGTVLYFEIRHKGTPQDPRDWLKR